MKGAYSSRSLVTELRVIRCLGFVNGERTSFYSQSAGQTKRSIDSVCVDAFRGKGIESFRNSLKKFPSPTSIPLATQAHMHWEALSIVVPLLNSRGPSESTTKEELSSVVS